MMLIAITVLPIPVSISKHPPPVRKGVSLLLPLFSKFDEEGEEGEGEEGEGEI